MSKFQNQPTNFEGKSFQSKLEQNRFQELALLEKSGAISDLQTQVTFRLDVNGQHICKYIADFVYEERGEQVVEDTKGILTDVFRLKAKLMKACLGIEVKLVRRNQVRRFR